jgi:hypothetical protein
VSSNLYPAATTGQIEAWAEATQSPVKGDHWNRQRLAMLDTPGLSPNQARQCDELVSSGEAEENGYVADWFVIGSHETGYKDRDLGDRQADTQGDLDSLKALLRTGDISSQDAVHLIREFSKVVQHYEGVIESVEREYQGLLDMRANPQGFLDALYAKSPSLAERRKRFI